MHGFFKNALSICIEDSQFKRIIIGYFVPAHLTAKYENDANFVCFKMMLIMTNSAILKAFKSLAKVAYPNSKTRDTVIARFVEAVETARDVMWR